MNDVIQQLKRVTLSVKPVHAASMDGSDERSQLQFFYGIAADGLTKFEMALSDQRVGNRLCCDIPSGQMGDYFGHLLPALRRAVGCEAIGPPYSLEVEVLAVEDSHHRELVQAMARSLGHGCGGGGCDCGCGGT